MPAVSDRAAPPSSDDITRWQARLGAQAHSAWQLGSSLYADLLARVGDDLGVRGPCFTVMEPYLHQASSSALGLRFLAAVHRIVLRRQAPALALHYPSVGGSAPVEGAWRPFRNAVEEHRTVLTDLTARTCQTNEVGRSAALAVGLLWLAHTYELPLHHREIGASAGLNLQWDAFTYGTADRSVTWGPADSAVDLTGHWEVPPPTIPRVVEVASRAGCDPRPGDPTTPETREDLTASVWPDQRARHARLKGALALASERPVRVDQAGAGEWLLDVLAERPPGVTVVTHSVVWRYIPEREREVIVQLLEDHGRDADEQHPIAWLRLEPTPPKMVYDGRPYPLTVTTWPGGTTRVLGHAQAHGQGFRWNDGHAG
ncbi:DUF2332 domain-containing protein [Euzebya tangerina]|uniref:DUF2332 domain-containing protein n=1 Tax=Euzebya tangerina TaxID=591198 RepID=UPI000E313963|nr:DUF2332 domain-containing protein [Euzebya tangerina]